MLARERQHFPTRNYPYRRPSPGLAADDAPEAPLPAGRLHAFVLGLDAQPRPMSEAEVSSLRDPFAELLLKRGTFPLTFRALLSALDAFNDDPHGLPTQQSFLAADGGQIRWTAQTAEVERLFRFAIVRLRDGSAELMISGSTALDSETQFVQLIAWDPVSAVYNFYERRLGTWIWAGDSRHALAPQTRGRGPFDSHVNGALVMKELRVPWNNWHSMDASITEAVLEPDDPLRNEPIFRDRVSADVLERSVVRPGIARWTSARFEAASTRGDGRLHEVRYFLRQVLETTTVNLASSGQQSAHIGDDSTLTLPTTFFLNTEALLDQIGLGPDIAAIRVNGRHYRESLVRYDFALSDGRYRQPGDTFFAFLVPEPAFEDLNVLAMLLDKRIVSRRFMACLLMIDFPNPILSARRKQLMRYVPETCSLLAAGGGLRSDLQDLFVAALDGSAAASDAQSVEAEFLANWRLPENAWEREFERRLETYFAALKAKSQTAEGFDAWVRLAESRRREFRSRPLEEFRLTTPTTNIPENAAALEMRADGSVGAVP
jgi:hypothetical protein